MAVITPIFAYPNDRQEGLGPTPTIFGTGQPGSQVVIYKSNSWDVLGSGVVDRDGKFAISVKPQQTNPGAFNAYGAKAYLNNEESGWSRDLSFYV